MRAPRHLSLAFEIATAIVGSRNLRCQVMVYAILIAAGQCLIASLLLPTSITERPWFLFFFWGFCLLLVLTGIGLALLELLNLRKQHSRELEHLKKTTLSSCPDDWEEKNNS